MITAKEAYSIMKQTLPDDIEIINMAECTNDYVFGTRRVDHQSRGGLSGYDKVNKKTGEVGFMIMFDYCDEVDAGTVSEIDISKIRRALS